MPKIIENLEQKLIAEARRQILETGYSATTIRSVAAACGVGTGTVYNYFTAKNDLVAAVMLGDWKKLLRSVQDTGGEDFEAVLRSLYNGLAGFRAQYGALFTDAAAIAQFPQAAGQFHPVLRSQLASPLRSYCPDDFTAEFIAEALLTWTLAGKDFGQLYGLIRKIIS